MWKISRAQVTHLFQKEPGIIAIQTNPRKNVRRYVSLRIPKSVLDRVRRRFTI